MDRMNNKMPVPVLFEKKEECCGCFACYSICPKNAISMVEDEEGFEYPIINDLACIRCKRCMNICPIKNHKDGTL